MPNEGDNNNPSKIDYKDFAANIKQKHPENKDVPDLELAEKWIERYPDYKDHITLPVKKNESSQESTNGSQDLSSKETNGEKLKPLTLGDDTLAEETPKDEMYGDPLTVDHPKPYDETSTIDFYRSVDSYSPLGVNNVDTRSVSDWMGNLNPKLNSFEALKKREEEKDQAGFNREKDIKNRYNTDLEKIKGNVKTMSEYSQEDLKKLKGTSFGAFLPDIDVPSVDAAPRFFQLKANRLNESQEDIIRQLDAVQEEYNSNVDNKQLVAVGLDSKERMELEAQSLRDKKGVLLKQLALVTHELSGLRKIYPTAGYNEEQRINNASQEVLHSEYRRQSEKLMSDLGLDLEEATDKTRMHWGTATPKEKESDITLMKEFIDYSKMVKNVGKSKQEVWKDILYQKYFPMLKEAVSRHDPHTMGWESRNEWMDNLQKLDEGSLFLKGKFMEGSEIQDLVRKYQILYTMAEKNLDPIKVFGWEKPDPDNTDFPTGWDLFFGPTLQEYGVHKAIGNAFSGTYEGVQEMFSFLPDSYNETQISANTTSAGLSDPMELRKLISESFSENNLQMTDGLKKYVENPEVQDLVASTMRTTANLGIKMAAGSKVLKGSIGLFEGLNPALVGQYAQLISAVDKVKKTTTNPFAKAGANLILNAPKLIETGLKYETVNLLYNEKGANFTSGAAGQAGADLAVSLISKLPGIAKWADTATIKMIAKMLGGSMGEFTEESIQTISQDGLDKYFAMMKDDKQRAAFLVSTMGMGIIAGANAGNLDITKWATKHIESMPPELRTSLKDYLGLTEIESAVDEKIDDKSKALLETIEEPDVDTEVDTDTEAEPDVDTEVDTDTEAEADVDTEVDTDTEAEADVDTEVDTDTEAEADKKAKVEAESDEKTENELKDEIVLYESLKEKSDSKEETEFFDKKIDDNLSKLDAIEQDRLSAEEETINDFDDSVGEKVNYEGIEGALSKTDDGYHVIDDNGDVHTIEGGLSGKTPTELGVKNVSKDKSTVGTEKELSEDSPVMGFDPESNKVVVYGKEYDYLGVETDKEGNTTAIRVKDKNGKTKFIRNEDAILEVEIQKELFESENATSNWTQEDLEAKIKETKVKEKNSEKSKDKPKPSRDQKVAAIQQERSVEADKRAKEKLKDLAKAKKAKVESKTETDVDSKVVDESSKTKPVDEKTKETKKGKTKETKGRVQKESSKDSGRDTEISEGSGVQLESKTEKDGIQDEKTEPSTEGSKDGSKTKKSKPVQEGSTGTKVVVQKESSKDSGQDTKKDSSAPNFETKPITSTESERSDRSKKRISKTMPPEVAAKVHAIPEGKIKTKADLKKLKDSVDPKYHAAIDREVFDHIQSKKATERSNRVKSQKKSTRKWSSEKTRKRFARDAKRLAKSVLGVDVETDPQAIQDAWIAKGKVGSPDPAFQHGNKVYVDIDQSGPDSLPHEFAHVWLQSIKNQSPALFQKGIDLIENSPEWKEDFGDLDVDKDKKLEEVEERLAEAIGLEVADLLDKSKIKRWVDDVKSWITKKLRLTPSVDLNKMTLPKMIKMAANELARGKGGLVVSNLKEPETADFNPSTFKMTDANVKNYYAFKAIEESVLSNNEEMLEIVEQSKIETVRSYWNGFINFIADNDRSWDVFQEKIKKNYRKKVSEEIKRQRDSGKIGHKEAKAMKKAMNSKAFEKTIGDAADVYALLDLQGTKTSGKFNNWAKTWFGSSSEEDSHGGLIHILSYSTNTSLKKFGERKLDENAILYKLREEGLTLSDVGFWRHLNHAAERNTRGAEIVYETLKKEIEKGNKDWFSKKGVSEETINDIMSELSKAKKGLDKDLNIELEKAKKIQDKDERKVFRDKAREAHNNELYKVIENIAGEALLETDLASIIPVKTSGFTTEDAQHRIDKIKGESTPEQLKLLEDVSKEMGKAFHDILDMKVDAGIITAESRDFLKGMFENYVPLRVIEKTDPSSKLGRGVYSDNIKKLQPSDKYDYWERENPEVAMFSDYQRALQDVHKNETLTGVAEMIRSHPTATINGKVAWEVSDKKPVGISTKKGDIEPIPFMENGELKWIMIRDYNLYKSLGPKTPNPKWLKQSLRVAQFAGNFWKTGKTALNIEFIPTNFSKDFQEALLNISMHDKKGVRRAVAKGVFPSMGAVRRVTLGKGNPSNKYDAALNRLIEAGGTIDFLDRADMQSIQKMINKQASKFKKSTPGVGAIKRVTNIGVLPLRASFKAIIMANKMTELGVRLSAFEALTSRGVSDQKAAQIAKNLTVNFDKKGDAGVIMNALYMFSNASVGGKLVMNKGLIRSKRIQKTLLAVAAWRVADLAAMYMHDDGEEDNPDKQTMSKMYDHEIRGNWMIPFGDEIYTIPIPNGMQEYTSIIDDLFFLAMGKKTVPEVVVDQTYSQARGWLPFMPANKDMTGKAGAWMPTLAQWPFEYSDNVDYFTGHPMYRDQYSKFSKEYNYEMGKANDPEYLKDITKVLFDATNGNVDINPSVIYDFLNNYAQGGVHSVIDAGRRGFEAANGNTEKILLAQKVSVGAKEGSRSRLIKQYERELRALLDKGSENKLTKEEKDKIKPLLTILAKYKSKSYSYLRKDASAALTQQKERYGK